MKELFQRAADGTMLSHRDLHIILDALPTPLSWALLPQGEIQFFNRAFKKTFGYADDSFSTVDQWIDQTYVNEDHRHLARARWKSLWASDGAGISEVDPLEIEIRSARGDIFTVKNRGILLHDIGVAIATFEDISDRKLAEERLRRISYEDPLTGAGNRRALHARWQDEIRVDREHGSQLMAVLLIDLDDFKPINDCMGHDVGDMALIAVAQRLRDCIRRSDLIFRIGGDEFVILLPGLKEADHLEPLCDRIAAAFKESFAIDDWQVSLGATIGVSLWPQDGSDLKELLRHADEALYRIKRTNKGHWELFRAPQGEPPIIVPH